MRVFGEFSKIIFEFSGNVYVLHFTVKETAQKLLTSVSLSKPLLFTYTFSETCGKILTFLSDFKP